jgi:hypothetical protein
LTFVPNWTGKTEKVGQEVVSYFGEDRFGVKLNSLYYIISVSHSHYYPFGSLGSDFEAGWKPLSFDNKGMVARCWEGIGQALIDGFAIVVDNGGLAMDWQCPTDFAPIDVANALMSQAHSQQRDFPTKVLHCLVRDTCF